MKIQERGLNEIQFKGKKITFIYETIGDALEAYIKAI